jgi:hypothetical protein
MILPLIGKSQNVVLKDTSINGHNFIELSSGPCLPIGDFAKTDKHDLYNNISGLAGLGFNINVSYNHLISKYFGLTVKSYYCSNQFKADELCWWNVSTANKGSYHTYGLFLGPIFRLAYNKITIKNHLLIGYLIQTEPKIDFNFNGNYEQSLKKMSAHSISSNIGLELICKLNKSWDFLVNVDFLNGSFHYDKYPVLRDYGYIYIDRGTQNFTVLNFNFGLGLKL